MSAVDLITVTSLRSVQLSQSSPDTANATVSTTTGGSDSRRPTWPT